MARIDEIKDKIKATKQELLDLINELNELEPQNKEQKNSDNKNENNDVDNNQESSQEKLKGNKSNQSQSQTSETKEEPKENNEPSTSNSECYEEQKESKDKAEQSEQNSKNKTKEEKKKSEEQNDQDSKESTDKENQNKKDNSKSTDNTTEEQQESFKNDKSHDNQNDNKQSSKENNDKESNEDDLESKGQENKDSQSKQKKTETKNNKGKSDETKNDQNKNSDSKEEQTEKQQKKSSEIKKSKNEKNEKKNNPKKDQNNEFSEEFLKSLEQKINDNTKNSFQGFVDQEINLKNQYIKKLIRVFINKKFKNQKTDLNTRAHSLNPVDGFNKWDIKDIIKHMKTKQLTKIPYDKMGYEYDKGKLEYIPLSFYFDMSGSMASYTKLLSIIAVELLKEDITVLVGFNESIEHQITCKDKKISEKELENILNGNLETKKKNIKIKEINENIDAYLIKAKAEKCVVFTDFDALNEVINLSKHTELYWLCFKNNYSKEAIAGYRGFIHNVQNKDDMIKAIAEMNKYKHKTLCYLQKEKVKEKTKYPGGL